MSTCHRLWSGWLRVADRLLHLQVENRATSVLVAACATCPEPVQKAWCLLDEAAKNQSAPSDDHRNH